jgi:hypothetical protein
MQDRELPAGVSDRDCSGPYDPRDEMSGNALFDLCSERQQRKIIADFADMYFMGFIDNAPKGEPPIEVSCTAYADAVIGFRADWLEFRDNAVGLLQRDGKIERKS